MKKGTALTLCAIVLLATMVAGGVYAVGDHQPMKGDKLIGAGFEGTFELPGTPAMPVQTRYARYRITNPNCLDDITIEQVSIIRSDGTVMYEGPFMETLPFVSPSSPLGWDVERQVKTEPMKPHESRFIFPQFLMTDSITGEWVHPILVAMGPMSIYTVEIKWTTKGKYPLIGWQQQLEIRDGQHTVSESPMVNMK